MSRTIHLRPDAETDIKKAATWYEKHQKGLGDEFLNAILNTFDTISDNPKMYNVIHRNTRRAIIHRFPFGIYYRIEEDIIVVVAVMHGSRHPKHWQKRN